MGARLEAPAPSGLHKTMPNGNMRPGKKGKPMKLIFTKFDAGHHGHVPAPVEVSDVDRAFPVFRAVSCALHQTESIEAAVVDRRGVIMARFVATDDENAGVGYPEPGDMVCSECGAFWALCGCEDGGFVPMEPGAVETRDPEMILKMNAEMGILLLERAAKKTLEQVGYRIITADGRGVMMGGPYEIITADGKVKYAGTGRLARFTLEDARRFVDRDAGEKIVKSNGIFRDHREVF